MKFKPGSLVIANTDLIESGGPGITAGKVYICGTTDGMGRVKILDTGSGWFEGHFNLVHGPKRLSKLEKVIYGIE